MSGYLAFHQFTSHMSGSVAIIAADIDAHKLAVLVPPAVVLFCFLFGAASCSVMVNWARRRRLHSEYALPLMLEAMLLLAFGLLGGHLEMLRWLFDPVTVLLLCFTMGLQNAIITKISHAEIRTTHVTGMVTDIGIELGKLIYWNRSGHLPPELEVKADRRKLLLLTALVGLFFFGGLVGALGFKHVGFIVTVPLALLLIVLAVMPVWDDITGR